MSRRGYSKGTGADRRSTAKLAMTPTAILATVQPSWRIKRSQQGGALQQLRNLDRMAPTAIKQLAYGVLWADETGRTTGSVSMALRRATPWQSAKLMAAMIADGMTVPAEVPAWLNRKGVQALA